MNDKYQGVVYRIGDKRLEINKLPKRKLPVLALYEGNVGEVLATFSDDEATFKLVQFLDLMIATASRK